MIANQVTYVSPERREEESKPCNVLKLTPWVIQNLIYEVAQSYMLANDPASSGYDMLKIKYDQNKDKTGVLLSIGHDWQGKTPGMTPAFFIFRQDMTYQRPIMNQLTGIDVAESNKEKLMYQIMTCYIGCVGKTVGVCEQLADWIETPFITFEEQIRNDFKLRAFRVKSRSAPQQYKQAVDNFIIVIPIEVVFDKGFVVHGDDLKIKTMDISIYANGLCNPPLSLQ